MNTVTKPSTGIHPSIACFPDSSEKVIPYFFKRMKLLIVDDEECISSLLEAVFSTPLIRVVKATNESDASALIAASPTHWHCWIVDMNLGKQNQEGLDIIERHSRFPFVIVYSGTGSMENAARAIRLGVAAVIDKSPVAINKLIAKTCSLLPLGLLCRGLLPKSRDIFFALMDTIIANHHEWAARVNLSLRQLENICSIHTGLTPSAVLPFYYGMQYLLHRTITMHELPVEYVVNDLFFMNCLEFVVRKIEMYGHLM